MKLRYTIGIVVCVLQAVLVLNAHSHNSQLRHHQDSDYFVRPIEKTSGLVYAGQFHPKNSDHWKWIALGEHSVRYRGKVLVFIYRYCSDFQHRGNPKHHRNASGRRRLLILESWRIDTHPSFFRSLCSCSKCIARPRLKKLSLHSGSLHYVIYYRGHAEIHEDKKTEHPVQPKTNAKPKSKRKMKQLEQHSRKRSHTKKEKFEPRNRKKERRRPRCGVSSHQ